LFRAKAAKLAKRRRRSVNHASHSWRSLRPLRERLLSLRAKLRLPDAFGSEPFGEDPVSKSRFDKPKVPEPAEGLAEGKERVA